MHARFRLGQYCAKNLPPSPNCSSTLVFLGIRFPRAKSISERMTQATWVSRETRGGGTVRFFAPDDFRARSRGFAFGFRCFQWFRMRALNGAIFSRQIVLL